ncbi:unnamed protein product [Paramecium pentaurelia]|uniref:Uncharacterized protein n=1 Tax=Paramecium pentaurelia TaxID=43138 RepID=A0A8S1S3F7_9CILI|nr:unnamed protein product [Paramecium pentaurelia]
MNMILHIQSPNNFKTYLSKSHSNYFNLKIQSKGKKCRRQHFIHKQHKYGYMVNIIRVRYYHNIHPHMDTYIDEYQFDAEKFNNLYWLLQYHISPQSINQSDIHQYCYSHKLNLEDHKMFYRNQHYLLFLSIEDNMTQHTYSNPLDTDINNQYKMYRQYMIYKIRDNIKVKQLIWVILRQEFLILLHMYQLNLLSGISSKIIYIQRCILQHNFYSLYITKLDILIHKSNYICYQN